VHGIAGAKDALCHVAPDLLDGGGEERTEVTTCDALQVRAAVHDLSHEELERTQVGRSEAGDALDRVGETDRPGLVAEALVDLRQPRDRAGQDGAVHPRLRGEVVEEHPLPDAGAGTNLAGRRPAKPARREYLLGRVANAAAGVPRGGQRGRGLYGGRHDVPTGTAPYPQPARAVNDFARRRGHLYRAVREPSAGWRRGAKGKARRAATSGAATRRRNPLQSQGQPPAGVQVPSIFTLELLKPPGRSNSTPENPSSSPTITAMGLQTG